jgi:hypothetical protein
MDRLRSGFPNAVNCSFEGPGSSLLRFKLIRRHWMTAFGNVTDHDLQYKTTDPSSFRKRRRRGD